MAGSISQEGTDDTGDAICGKPEASPEGLFLAGPEHRRQQNKCRGYDSLQPTKEESDCEEATEVRYGSLKQANHPPHEQHTANESTNGISL